MSSKQYKILTLAEAIIAHQLGLQLYFTRNDEAGWQPRKLGRINLNDDYPFESAEDEFCAADEWLQCGILNKRKESDLSMISYSHKNGSKTVRFYQYKRDKLPPWAVDVQDYELDSNNEGFKNDPHLP